jgi:hypothetical protein
MDGRQTSGRRRRWSGVLLGGMAGLGVPVLLLGVGRLFGVRGGPATVGGVAGLLGALVGEGLARRSLRGPVFLESEQPSREERGAAELEPRAEELWEPPRESPRGPPRGPGGRERHWLLQAPPRTA